MAPSSVIFNVFDKFMSTFMHPARLKNVTIIKHRFYDLSYSNGVSTDKPILINIHGGGFVSGDKSSRRYLCDLFANDGWFVINANYRLCPKVKIMDQVADVWGIIERIEKIAHKYDLDTSTIVITGDSAGAFLSAYMIAIMNSKELQEKFKIKKLPNIKFSAGILFCGVYDIDKALNTFKGPKMLMSNLIETMTGIKLKTIEDIKKYKHYDYLSIIKYLNSNWCPIQLFYAKKDLLLAGESERLYSALKSHNIPVEQHYTNSVFENHCYHLNFGSKASKSAIKLALDYLSKIKHK